MPAVDAWGPNSFRVRWAAPGFPLAESPYSPYVAQADANAKASASPARTFEKAPGVLASVNGNLEVDVDAATGLVSVLRVSDGHLLMQQTALLWTPASCYGAVCPSADLPPSAELQFNGYVTEVFVGGGEQGTRRRVTLEENFGRDYADTEYYGYNSGRQAFLPLFFSSVGYGFMNAQPGYGHMQWQSAVAGAPLATPGVQQSVFNASSIKVVDVWFTTTPGTPVFNESVPHPFLALLDQYADAVGHAPLMPAFASGFIASKDRYRNQTQFLDVARGYIARNIPISMLTVDWFHWPALGDMAFKPECWPDPQAMIDELRGLGIETMVTHWPFMSSTSAHRAEYEAAGALALNVSSGKADVFWAYLQEGALITTMTDATRQLTEDNWNAGYGKYGVRAMWLDETEPDRTGQADHALRIGQWTYEGSNSVELGPTWRQQWLRTMTGTLEHKYGLGNFFLMSRSAWLGTAKWGHVRSRARARERERAARAARARSAPAAFRIRARALPRSLVQRAPPPRAPLTRSLACAPRAATGHVERRHGLELGRAGDAGDDGAERGPLGHRPLDERPRRLQPHDGRLRPEARGALRALGAVRQRQPAHAPARPPRRRAARRPRLHADER
jgi:alpha-glucosidase (family GH31 glycosyl hydrolase)